MLVNAPESKEFYEKTVLKRLITNKLLDQIVIQKNIVITDQEAREYLAAQLTLFNSNDKNAAQFFEAVKEMGFSSLESYFNDNNTIAATKKLLAKGKLAAEIVKDVPEPTENEIDEYIVQQANNEKSILEQKSNPELRKNIKEYLKQKKIIGAYNTFKDELLAKGSYKINIPVTIN